MIKFFFYKFFGQAALIWGCLFVFGCENSQRSLDEWKEKKTMVEEATNIQSLLSQGGKMKAKLTSPLMLRYTADTVYTEFPKTLHVNFFDSTGKVESQLNALYGKYFESLNKVYLRDSVIVFNIKGDTLWTPDLWWDQASQKFYTDKRVRIYRNGDRIYGKNGLIASQDLSEIIIKQPSGTVIVPDSLAVQ